MTSSAFFGHALLGLGPGVAFFCVIIAPKSFVVLLTLFSAFLWLVVLLLASALLRGFVPLLASSTQPQLAAAYAGALLAAVAVEEAARYWVWRLHRMTLALLHDMSEASGHTFTPVDELYLSVGWGYGQAAVHVLILFGSLLPLTAGHGTVYAATCPQMSVFLMAALNSLGMGATLVALSVVALDAWSRRGPLSKAYAPLMHAAAALLTLGSMQQDGCVKAVAAQLALGLINTGCAAAIAWRLTSNSSCSISSRSSSRRGREMEGRISGSGRPPPLPLPGVTDGQHGGDAAAVELLGSPAAAAEGSPLLGATSSPPPALSSRASSLRSRGAAASSAPGG